MSFATGSLEAMAMIPHLSEGFSSPNSLIGGPRGTGGGRALRGDGPEEAHRHDIQGKGRGLFTFARGTEPASGQWRFAHENLRSVAVRPKPHDAQYPFRLWYECLPQRRQRMWEVRFPIFPSDAVPFVMDPASRRDVDHVVAADDRELHLLLRRAVQELLRVAEDDVQVGIESVQDAAVPAPGLQLDEDVRVD